LQPQQARLARRAADLDAALSAEQQRRLHAAKLRRTLSRLDADAASRRRSGSGAGGDGGDAGVDRPAGASSRAFSYYSLQPAQQAMLAAVLRRDDAALERDDPFDPHSLLLGATDDGGAPGGGGGGTRADDAASQQPEGVAAGSQSASRSITPRAAGADAMRSQLQPGLRGSMALAALFAQPQRRPGTTGSRSASCDQGGSVVSPSAARCSRLAEIDEQLGAIEAERARRAHEQREQGADAARVLRTGPSGACGWWRAEPRDTSMPCGTTPPRER
jgi:hypothetical protein